MKKPETRKGAIAKMVWDWSLVAVTLMAALSSQWSSETMDSKLKKVELKSRPRSVLPQQHSNLVQCLRQWNGPAIPMKIGHEYFSNAQESEAYMNQIGKAITDAEISIAAKDELVLAMNRSAGVLIFVLDKDHPPPGALFIQKCFKSNEIFPAEIVSAPPPKTPREKPLGANTVLIFVSNKP